MRTPKSSLALRAVQVAHPCRTEVGAPAGPRDSRESKKKLGVHQHPHWADRQRC